MRPSVCRCGLAPRRANCARSSPARLSSRASSRPFSSTHSHGFSWSRSDRKDENQRNALLETWNKYYEPLGKQTENESRGQYVGYMGKRRNVSKKLSFADLTLASGKVLQLCSRLEHDPEAHAQFRSIPAHSPVIVKADPAEPDPAEPDPTKPNAKVTLNTKGIQALNEFPDEVIVTPEVMFPQTSRNLQIRFHPELQARLRFRSWLKNVLHQGLMEKGFTDVETPTLFKSTPEGAREFLVPTRNLGKAYALTQSPQQYKQVLVASGISRYMQWARCYRDEDSRADRQPEFSQLDMEWAFAGTDVVRKDVNDIVLKALSLLKPAQSYRDFRNGERIPVISGEVAETEAPAAHQFTTLTFAEAIANYGIDKPDLRIPGRIHQVPIPETAQHFVSMITYLETPVVEGFSFSLKDSDPATSRKLVTNFMDNLPKQFIKNPDGMPQVLIFDSTKPSAGFSSIGPEYESVIDAVTGGKELEDGDLVVFQARTPVEGQYTSSSTKLGEVRGLLWKHLVENGQMDEPRLGDPGSLQFAWVTEFPMFQPVEEDEPWKLETAGAGIAASHHPFTAPLSQADFEMLFSDPLQARSAAYDLVLNGVEVGGGSRRNHRSDVQRFIMEDVLNMPQSRVADFSHLFAALDAGCPPHAGFALGFDRLVALLTDTTTVRDVIAFPKTMKGDDPFVKSPSWMTDGQLHEYGVKLSDQAEKARGKADDFVSLERSTRQ